MIFVGRATQEDMVSRTIEYMIANDYIKRNDLAASKAWESKTSEKVVKKYYNQMLGLEYEK